MAVRIGTGRATPGPPWLPLGAGSRWPLARSESATSLPGLPALPSPIRSVVADSAAPKPSTRPAGALQEGAMLARQGLRSGLRTWAAARPVVARGFAAEVENHQEAVVPEKFKEDWKKIAPNYDLPHFPSSYMAARPPVPSTLPSKLTVNFVLPHAFEMQAKEVDMVIVPATSGQMGVLPGHVPTIAELKPGLMSVHEGSDVKQYFVSSGFAFVHANSVADIIAIEAVPLDRVDPEEVRKGVQEYAQKVTSAKDDLERAEAQIGLEVHSALQAALGVSS